MEIPKEFQEKVMVIKVKTYLGRQPNVVPFASSHAVQIVQNDDFFVDFYPEMSENLVEGMPNKVYFEVKTSNGEPV